MLPKLNKKRKGFYFLLLFWFMLSFTWNKEMLQNNFILSKLQYIQPHEHEKLSQVELLVIDEAAAIPLPIVKSLLGPYLVFLSSTVNGYGICYLLLVYILHLSAWKMKHFPFLGCPIKNEMFPKMEIPLSLLFPSLLLYSLFINSQNNTT